MSAVPTTELQNLASALHKRARENAALSFSVMQDTGDDLTATGYVASAGAYEQCARLLDALISEWNVLPDLDTPPDFAEVQL